MCVQAGTAAPDHPMAKKCVDGNPAVEEIQDLVEQALTGRITTIPPKHISFIVTSVKAT